MASPGAMTFLFTDIEGSTSRWERDPEGMKVSLELHDTLVNDAIAKRGGVVFKQVGDGVCASFNDPTEAIEGSVEIEKALGSAPWPGAELRVRIGIHTGLAEARGGDFFGPAVNKAARICAAGSGGQILVSEVTRTLVSGAPARRLSFLDLGPRLLKGIELPERLFQVSAEGLASDFPPLSAPTLRQGNLLEEATSFVGRDRALAELESLLAKARVVMLTGPGGIGKTRLALRVAARDRAASGAEAWIAALGESDEAADAETAIIRALGLPDSEYRREGGGQLGILEDFFRSRSAILVLDGCDRLASPVAKLVPELLACCPGLRMLLTSRGAIALPGAFTYRVTSLGQASGATDRSDASRSSKGLDSESVRLFVDRFLTTRPGASVDARFLSAAAEICTRLDGLPLAIELVASKARYYSLEEIEGMVSDPLVLAPSGGGARGARGLKSLVDSGWALLSDGERALLQSLSVFRSPFELREVITVGGADCRPFLEDLVDHSMVSMEERDGSARYSILGIVREYAARRAREAGAWLPAREAVAGPWLADLRKALGGLRGSGYGEAMRFFLDRRATLVDLASGSSPASDAGPEAPRPELAGLTAAFLEQHGDLGAAESLCERVLSAAPEGPVGPEYALLLETAALVKLGYRIDIRGAFALAERLETSAGSGATALAAAYRVKGLGARWAALPAGRGDAFGRKFGFADSERFFREALALSEGAGDRVGARDARTGIGLACLFEGRLEEANAILGAAAAESRASCDPVGLVMALLSQSNALFRMGDREKARMAAAEGLDAASTMMNEGYAVMLRWVIGSAALAEAETREGALEEAERVFRSIYEDGKALGIYRFVRLGVINLAPILGALGKAEECEAIVRERAAEPHCRGNAVDTLNFLFCAAAALVSRGEHSLAAYCHGASYRSLSSPDSGAFFDPGDLVVRRLLEARMIGALGPDEYRKAFATGGAAAGPVAAFESLESRYPGSAALAAAFPATIA